ncbi:MAG TPA: hypothetical protein VMW25_00225 [Clostridia bacterium]|nr:hypothetical protein [Clostridia bacterium]
MANEIDVNEVANADVTNAGKYLVYNIFVGIGDVIVIIILVGVATVIMSAFGLAAFLKFKK